MDIHLNEEERQAIIHHLEGLVKQATNQENVTSLENWFSIDHKLTCIDDPNHVVSTDPQVATLVDAIHILRGESVPLKPEFLLPRDNN